MEQRQIGMGEVVSATLALLRAHAGMCLAVILAITVGYTLLDLSGALAANTIATVAVSVFGQYIVTEQLLAHRMSAPLPARRYGALFLAGLLSGLGMFLGLILLILPGVFLIARWSIATPFVVAEQKGPVDALKASWAATARSWPALFGLALIAGIIVIGAVIGLVFVAEANGLVETSLLIALPTNLLVGGATVLAWLMGVAVYELCAGGESSVSQVFS